MRADVVKWTFLQQTKHSLHFIKLKLDHWSHMDYLNDVFSFFTFLDLKSSWVGFLVTQTFLISLKISSFVFRRWTYRCGITQGLVGLINDIILIFWLNYLKISSLSKMQSLLELRVWTQNKLQVWNICHSNIHFSVCLLQLVNFFSKF